MNHSLAKGGDMQSTMPKSGSAEKWGPLWGDRPRDWAEIEDQQVPTYAEAIRRVGVTAGQRVLDIGCGTGVFLRLVAERGAVPFGLDASEALLETAGERVPEADLRLGDMELLPYEDEKFDLVTGFNSFFFAADLVAALREAGRVAKPGAAVVIQVWGRPERCDLEAQKQVARRYFPPPPPDAPAPPKLWEPGVLEQLASEAGLTPEATSEKTYAFEFPDEDTLGRLLMAPMGTAELAGLEHEDALRRDSVAALAAQRAPDGSYRLENEFHYLVARA